MSQFGLYGLAVMGQNFALNIAEHGFTISVHNRSAAKVDECVARAQKELGDKAGNLRGFKDAAEFVNSLAKPRTVMFLVQAGAPVDSSIELFKTLLEPGDLLIDGGNEYFHNTRRRGAALESTGILYMGMGISGGEEGARKGPALMPGGPKEAYDRIAPIITAVAAQTSTGACTTYIGPDGSGNYVKMVHNGIEYGDMQLISEAYTILKSVGGLSNQEIAEVFDDWNKGELDSFLVEITAKILAKKDEDVYTNEVPAKLFTKGDKTKSLVDFVLDKTGNKGTGKMTMKEAADTSIACSTMSSALDARFIAFDKDVRVLMAKEYPPLAQAMPKVDKAQLVKDVRYALYASKVCSYAQGWNLMKAASKEFNWNVDLADCARIFTGGCIIRAKFLHRITAAYKKNPELASLLVDPDFKAEIKEREQSWRRVVSLCAAVGLPIPSMYASLAYFDQYRRADLDGASLVQCQRDYFGSHTFERKDQPRGVAFHCKWTDGHAIAE
ncbi:6-phosphogluconate dehydrogenase (decarboxylating) [Batrachochytrium salamandrivorans]|nr:6-phosphogluconate dehydrogenase (decarboxylating) [Batrachochytrium salamandrivorans]